MKGGGRERGRERQAGRQEGERERERVPLRGELEHFLEGHNRCLLAPEVFSVQPIASQAQYDSCYRQSHSTHPTLAHDRIIRDLSQQIAK
eukprot:2451290-Rhodomonas_salina.4